MTLIDVPFSVDELNEAQIELLQKLMPKNNYRETQPLNGRAIYHEIITDGYWI